MWWMLIKNLHLSLMVNLIYKLMVMQSNDIFDLSKYPKGVYLLKVRIGDELGVEKIIHQ